eukprot:Selendium_serpulae@DN686_c0_g1_i1.p2
MGITAASILSFALVFIFCVVYLFVYDGPHWDISVTDADNINAHVFRGTRHLSLGGHVLSLALMNLPHTHSSECILLMPISFATHHPISYATSSANFGRRSGRTGSPRLD